jgi:hypothetical protein
MATLTAAKRKKLPKSSFGLPGSDGYPMPDKTHARLAKSGASRALNVGNISSAEKAKIDAKADAMLARAYGGRIEGSSQRPSPGR